jgi:hypothetical protein
VEYRGVDLKRFQRVTVELASASYDRRVELRTGSAQGPVIAEIPVPCTGDAFKFETVTVNLVGPTASGVQDLFLTFAGSPAIVNIRSFLFWGNAPRTPTAAEAGLAAYYRFDEGKDRHTEDVSGNSHGTIFVGDKPQWEDGRLGRAVRFEKSYFECGHFDPAGEAGRMSVAFWAQWKGEHGYYQGLVSKRDGWGNDKMMWQIGMDRAGARVDFRSAEGASVGANLPRDQWVHVAVTYDQGFARFYLNGRQTEEKNGIRLGTARRAKVRIGAAQECPDYFNGLIDEVRFYRCVLTASEVAQLVSTTRD